MGVIINTDRGLTIPISTIRVSTGVNWEVSMGVIMGASPIGDN